MLIQQSVAAAAAAMGWYFSHQTLLCVNFVLFCFEHIIIVVSMYNYIIQYLYVSKRRGAVEKKKIRLEPRQ